MPRATPSILFLFLAACGLAPMVRATSADAQGVTFEVPSGRKEDATRQAILYCANLGRSAVLVSIYPETTDLSVAVYDCR